MHTRIDIEAVCNPTVDRSQLLNKTVPIHTHKATKFHAFHVRFSGGTGRRSSFYEHECQQFNATGKNELLTLRNSSLYVRFSSCETSNLRNSVFAERVNVMTAGACGGGCLASVTCMKYTAHGCHLDCKGEVEVYKQRRLQHVSC